MAKVSKVYSFIVLLVSACLTVLASYDAGAGALKKRTPGGNVMVPSTAEVTVPVETGPVSCTAAKRILTEKGYGQIEAFDCAGPLLRFKVKKGARQMVVLMHADSAGYVEVY